MTALKGTEIERVAFEDALDKLKVVPQNRYDEAVQTSPSCFRAALSRASNARALFAASVRS